mgnify:CR=1 FL=1
MPQSEDEVKLTPRARLAPLDGDLLRAAYRAMHPERYSASLRARKALKARFGPKRPVRASWAI